MNSTALPAPTDAELADLVSAAARRLRRAAMEQLTPLGLTWGQARLLQSLACTAHRPRMADIAAAMGVGARTATAMVDGLEAAGMAARTADPEDRRAVLVRVTPTGRRVLRRMEAARSAAATSIFGCLDDTARRELERLLTALSSGSGCSQHHAGAGIPSARHEAGRGR